MGQWRQRGPNGSGALILFDCALITFDSRRFQGTRGSVDRQQQMAIRQSDFGGGGGGLTPTQKETCHNNIRSSLTGAVFFFLRKSSA